MNTLFVGLSASQAIGLCEFLVDERLYGDKRQKAEKLLNDLIIKNGVLTKDFLMLSLGNVQGLERFVSSVDKAIEEYLEA